MKYTTVIDNITARKWGLSIQEAYLFDWLFSLPSWANKAVIENEVYYFASKNKAVEELPMLTDKPDTMYRYYKSLQQKELILLSKIASKDYVALTDKAKQWNGNKSEHSENNPTKLGNKSENNSENNPTYKNIRKDKNIIDNDVVVTPEQKPEVPAFIQQQQQEFRDQVNQSELFPKLNKKETLDILKTDLDLINQVLREFKKSNIKTDSFCLTNNDIYKCTENFKSWYESMIEDCITKAHNKNEYPKKLGDTKMHVINFLRYQDFAKLKVQLTPKETVTNQVYDRQYD